MCLFADFESRSLNRKQEKASKPKLRCPTGSASTATDRCTQSSRRNSGRRRRHTRRGKALPSRRTVPRRLRRYFIDCSDDHSDSGRIWMQSDVDTQFDRPSRQSATSPDRVKQSQNPSALISNNKIMGSLNCLTRLKAFEFTEGAILEGKSLAETHIPRAVAVICKARKGMIRSPLDQLNHWRRNGCGETLSSEI